MIPVTPDLAIPDEEISFATSRSGGPGGQNVNKLETRVTVRFDVEGSAALSEEQKARLRERLATRITKDGVLQVTSQPAKARRLDEKRRRSGRKRDRSAPIPHE